MRTKSTPCSILHTFALLILISYQGYGQWGLRAHVNFENHQSLEKAITDIGGSSVSLSSPGYGAGLNYWFTLKKKRIEFLPELSYSYGGNFIDNATEASFHRYSFHFHTQIYALDLNEDCNCPTFAKQGPSINKGFFIHFSPGISFQQFAFTLDKTSSIPENSQQLKTNQLLWNVGLGLGLDLGLSELITLTPIASYYFYGDEDYHLALREEGVTNASFTQWQFSTRLGFRFDYKRQKYGRRR